MLTESKDDYSFTQAGDDDAIARALAAGKQVIKGAPNLLLLDFDSADAHAAYLISGVRKMVHTTFGFLSEASWPSSTAGHMHVAVTLTTALSAQARSALQAALGSDPYREVLAILGTQEGVTDPHLLFRPAPAGARMITDDLPF